MISESGGYDAGGDGGGGDLTINGLSIGIIAGCVAGVVLFAILGIYVYHNKIVRPRSAVRPYHGPHQHMDKGMGGVNNMGYHQTYVQDIYLPNMSDFHTPRNMPPSNRSSHHRYPVAIKDDDVLWARRVISMPPNRQSGTGF